MNEKDIKILVTDDSSFMRKYIINTLKESGFSNIIEASNGEEAVKKFKEEKPNIVLLDIIMPVKTGLEALKEIVENDGNVLIVSAMGQKSIIVKAIKNGAKDFIIKPFFSVGELKEKILKFAK